MKAVANGGIHMSVLDGWWWEAYQPGLGWAVGRSRLDDDPEAQDAFDANSVYDLLENQVRSAFYERDPDGVPQRWVEMMKASIEAFAPQFNTSRMVAEYATAAYAPAAASWKRLRGKSLDGARELAAWLERVRSGWNSVKVLDVADAKGEGSGISVTVQVHPGQLRAEELRVDAVWGPASVDGVLTPEDEAPLALLGQGRDGTARFQGAFDPLGGGRHGFAIRVMPSHPLLHDPFGVGMAHWA
jgi:starch phosphorylase